jgi:hypothetical protein
MASKEDIKLNLERLRIENEIAQSIERQTASLSNWRAGQKELRENAKQIKKLEGDIKTIIDSVNEAKKKGIQFSQEEQELIDKNVAKLQQKRDQLVATNKELGNSINLLKAAGNSMIASVKSVLPSLSSVISTVLDLDDKLKDTAASIGLSGAGFDAMKQSTEELRDESTRWAYGLNGGVQLMASFNEETGRAVILSKEAGTKMMEVARATGMSLEEMGGLTGGMEAFGLGATQAAQTIADIQSMSEQMGVNSGKVIKKFQQNLGLLNKMNFRGGMAALAKLAAHSEKFKLSMESIAGVSSQVFRPEGAIEASARLQTMGGAMAQLGDPFQLMYQARNAPEELAKSLTKAARESATFNKQTGEFEMSAHEMDRLRESADALGMDYQELVQTAKQAAKIDYFEQYLGGMSEEDKGLITGMTQMTKRGAEITFTDADGKLQTKLLGDLKDEEKKTILKRAESDKKRTEQAMSVAKTWQSIQDALMLVAVEVLQPLVDYLDSEAGKTWINGIKDTIIKFAGSIRDFFGGGGGWEKLKAKFVEYKDIIITGLAIGVAAFIGIWIASQFLAGAKFGLGFRSTSGVGGGGSPGGGGGMLGGLGKMLGGLGGGAMQLLALGGAIILLATGLKMMAEIPLPTLIVSFLGLMGVLLAFSVLAPLLTMGVGVLLALGAAFLMIGTAVLLVSYGISMIIDSFTSMFSIISMENIGPLMLLGPALMLASLGIMALAASILFMGIALANPFGLLGLIGLASAATSLKEAFGGVSADGIVKAVDAVNSVNKDNIDALKDLSMWLAFAGSNIKIEFGEIHVDGEIDLKGSGGTTASSGLLKDPIFMRELKKVIAEHTHFDKKGGR